MINTKKPLILAVDDRVEQLATISEMLQDRYTVIGAASYIDAVDILEKMTPVLFLLDIDMPTFDGFDTAEMIRMDSRFKSTPIIYLTSRADKESVIKAVTSGGNDYVIKPVKKGILVTKMEKYLDRE